MKKEGIAAIILSKMKPKQEEASNDSEPAMEVNDGQESAMEEFIAAVGKKDAKSAALALRSFLDMCDDDSEEEKEEEI